VPESSAESRQNNLDRSFKFIAPVVALSLVIGACSKKEKEITIIQTPTAITREVSPIPTLETPVKNEVPKEKSYELVVDEGLNPEAVENFKKTIDTEMSKFSSLGTLKIKIYKPGEENKTQNYYYFTHEDGPTILMNGDTLYPELSASNLRHELAHFYNPQTNKQYLQTILEPHQLDAYTILYNEAVKDELWGIPDGTDIIKAFFNENQKTAIEFPTETDSYIVLHASAKNYALSFLLTGKSSPQDTRENIFSQILAEPLADIEVEAIANPVFAESAPYMSVRDALEDPFQQEILGKLSEKYPIVKIGLDELKNHQDIMTLDALYQLENSESGLQISGTRKGTWTYSIIKHLVVMEIRNAHFTKNLEALVKIPDQLRQGLKEEMAITNKLAYSENFSEQIKVSTMSPAWAVIEEFKKIKLPQN